MSIRFSPKLRKRFSIPMASRFLTSSYRIFRSNIGFFFGKKYNLLSNNVIDSSKPDVLHRLGHQFSMACAMSLFLFYSLYIWLGHFFLIIFIVYGFLYTLYCLQDLLLYQQNEPDVSRLIVQTPDQFFLPYEKLSIPTADYQTLHGYLIKQVEQSDQCETLIFFHGNAGNIGHRLQNAQLLYHTCHINILLFDYRGYGKSTGTPSETGLYIDARAVYDYVRQRTDIHQGKIFIFGRSLGGAVAVNLAAHLSQTDVDMPLHSVLLENTFTSIPDMRKRLIPFFLLDFVPRWCYKNLFDSATKIKYLTVPVLFLSADQDELVPPEMMQKLHDDCESTSKVMQTFPDGQHNTTWICRNYPQVIRQFLDQVNTNSNSTQSIRRESHSIV